VPCEHTNDVVTDGQHTPGVGGFALGPSISPGRHSQATEIVVPASTLDALGTWTSVAANELVSSRLSSALVGHTDKSLKKAGSAKFSAVQSPVDEYNKSW